MITQLVTADPLSCQMLALVKTLLIELWIAEPPYLNIFLNLKPL